MFFDEKDEAIHILRNHTYQEMWGDNENPVVFFCWAFLAVFIFSFSVFLFLL